MIQIAFNTLYYPLLLLLFTPLTIYIATSRPVLLSFGLIEKQERGGRVEFTKLAITYLVLSLSLAHAWIMHTYSEVMLFALVIDGALAVMLGSVTGACADTDEDEKLFDNYDVRSHLTIATLMIVGLKALLVAIT